MLNTVTSQNNLAFRGPYGNMSVATETYRPGSYFAPENETIAERVPLETLQAFYMPETDITVNKALKTTNLTNKQRHKLVRNFSRGLTRLSEMGKLDKKHVQALLNVTARGIDARIEDIRSNPALDGIIAQCVTDYPTKDGDCNLVASSILYINFDVADERIIQNTVHEFTHLLQDNTQEVKIFSEKAKRYGGVSKHSQAFKDFEMAFLEHFYMKGILQHQDSTLRTLENSRLKDPTEEFEFVITSNIPLCEGFLNDAINSNSLKNRKFAMQFFIRQLQDEIEAYKEGFQTKKELTNIPKDSPIIQDLVPRLYEQMVSFIMVQQLEEFELKCHN